MPNVHEMLLAAAQELRECSSTPRLDAEILLANILGLSRSQLISAQRDEIDSGRAEHFVGLIARRKSGEPIAYIVGLKEFWGLDFEVDRRVLVPRPETELLVERALRLIHEFAEPLRLLDLGTGAGCIAVSIACELKRKARDFRIIAVDWSRQALEVAKRNVDRHGAAEQIELVHSNWFESLSCFRGAFQVILSNPPYVEDGAPAASELKFEPKEALFAGRHGMREIERLLLAVTPFLAPSGVFLCEMGSDQRKLVEQLFAGHAQRELASIVPPRFYKDLAGHDRMFEIRKG